MSPFISFFEIPATDFNRAVRFYENLFGCQLQVMECETEKMAFFPGGKDDACPGAISHAETFKPSGDGVLIHFSVKSIPSLIPVIEQSGGKILTSETKIEAEGKGSFALFLDSEGNRLGLHSQGINV